MIEREGNRLALKGSITFANVLSFREHGLQALDRDGLIVDLAAVSESDSSALSLLLEWQRAARARGFSLTFENLPPGLRSLAQVYGIEELIPLANP